jgi:D-Tyr-tRNAtyr deacylase
VVVQRVKSASVSVDGELISSIGRGVLALAAVSRDDELKDCEKAANKVLNLRLWDDDNGGRVCTMKLLSPSFEIAQSWIVTKLSPEYASNQSSASEYREPWWTRT